MPLDVQIFSGFSSLLAGRFMGGFSSVEEAAAGRFKHCVFFPSAFFAFSFSADLAFGFGLGVGFEDSDSGSTLGLGLALGFDLALLLAWPRPPPLEGDSSFPPAVGVGSGSARPSSDKVSTAAKAMARTLVPDCILILETA